MMRKMRMRRRIVGLVLLKLSEKRDRVGLLLVGMRASTAAHV